MKRFLFFIILFLNLLFASTNKEILLLHSYNKGYKWSDDISKAIEKAILPYKNIKLTTVYMDTKRVYDDKYLKKLSELYKEQFKNSKFDLLIVSDDNALDFIEQYPFISDDIPTLFCGINNLDKIKLKQNMTGVVEKIDLEKNFELILKLQKRLKKLIIINDKSKTALAIKHSLKPIIKKYKNKIDIEYLDSLDIKSLKKKILKLDSKTNAILFGLLLKDTTGKYFTYKQSLEQIKEVSSTPIYGLWDFYLGSGITGGLLTSANAQGKAVSTMALDVLLNNKKIKDIPIVDKSPNMYMFDYKELKKFNLEPSKFIKDFIVINKPSNTYIRQIKLIILSLVLIFILSSIVFILRANINKRKKVEKALLNRLEFDKVLLDTMPNPIYYKNCEGKFLGCNTAFASLVGSSKDEVIGKTAFDFFPYSVASNNVILDKEILKTLKTRSSDFTFYTPENKMKHIILNKAVYKNIDGSIGGIVCIMDDITERIQQKQFLIQQSKLAEMGEMVSSVAHQWNEPLVHLSALVQDIQTSYLLKELEDIDVQEFVNDSMVQIKYMSKTLSDFRNFLKPSTKKSLFSISKALNEINEIVGKQIFYSNIIMNFNYKNKNEELLIYGYENEFKQVLLNIINNAKNKIIEKQKQFDKKAIIDINIEKYEKYNQIEIIDDAGAIDEKIIKSIFDPYFTTKKNGSGIGLYMAKVIIEDKMQGSVTVRNDGESVIFSIKLPFLQTYKIL